MHPTEARMSVWELIVVVVVIVLVVLFAVGRLRG
jgi:Sec-independent protein translocase protein TatA